MKCDVNHRILNSRTINQANISDAGESSFSGKPDRILANYPDLLTVDHIQELTGLSKQTIRSLINDGSLPGCRIGRRLFVPKAKFIAFVNGEL